MHWITANPLTPSFLPPSSQAFYCSPWASVLGIQVGAQALSVVAIVVVNLILPYTIQFLSSIEWHTTNSSQSRSVARALIIMFFLNTAISIMVANAYLPGELHITLISSGAPLFAFPYPSEACMHESDDLS
jgi:hypothetical protein